MSITAYSGLPGHGKSFGVVANVIVPSLEQKRPIFTNIPVNPDLCRDRFGMAPIHFDIQEIIDSPNWWTDTLEPGSILVIDECWRLWPAGQTSANMRIQDKTFIAEHRHMVGENGFSTEIVLVTQDLSQICHFVRSLVETTYRVQKLSNVGLNKTFRVDVYSGPVTGTAPPKSKRERSIPGKFSKNIFELYQSHTHSKTGIAGDETRTDKRFNVLGRLSFKLGFLFFVLCLIFVIYGFQYLLQFYGFTETTELDAPSDSSGAQTSSAPGQSTTQANNVLLPAVVPLKSERRGPLESADSLEIIFNNKSYFRTEYVIRAFFPDNKYFDMNEMDLSSLGYEIYPVNQCLIEIRTSKFSEFAMCKNTEPERDRGVIENSISGVGERT